MLQSSSASLKRDLQHNQDITVMATGIRRVACCLKLLDAFGHPEFTPD